MNIHEEGQAAKELLANPLLQDTLATIESTITDQWIETKDTLLREELWFTLQGQKRFRTLLENLIERSQYELVIKEKFNE
jgi:hypothetical protein